ncbi:hypothetical protein [Serinicoccus kebangsaanensis]|uniref:hypothetical protein n=1 Tax=Serinicoccus kebangsaanensis TaxID=2602069 RepID=UPI00124D2A02|nr:hypothetical protein [Serinicoccus kebangsaanensis]
MKRAYTLTSAAALATLALAGCGGVGMTDGVVIEGTGYSVDEVQEAAQQLSDVSPEPVTVPTVIYQAGVAPLLSGLFDGTSYEVTETDVRGVLADAGLEGEASELTVQAATFQQYGAVINDQAALADEELAPVVAELQTVTAEDIGALPVQVNPRFGSWSATGDGVLPQVPEWITAPES